MHYMIHACLKRVDYVTKYLIPSMIEQGIKLDDIYLYIDYAEEGNLKSCIKSFSLCVDEGSTWHLQDDVIISRDFKGTTEKDYEGIVCGFCDTNVSKPQWGKVYSDDMWWSFPCICIPNYVARGFSDWFDLIKNDKYYEQMIKRGCYDDSFFKEYIYQRHRDISVLNLNPNIVDHIDYIIGGSVVNKNRINIVRSSYFNDKDLIAELKRKMEV